jgi:hypothetical protein
LRKVAWISFFSSVPVEEDPVVTVFVPLSVSVVSVVSVQVEGAAVA